MGKKSKKLPKENMRASSEEFFRGGGRCPGPSIDTNGQEVSTIFQQKFFRGPVKNLGHTGYFRRGMIDVTASR
jgi:hypothetical protein